MGGLNNGLIVAELWSESLILMVKSPGADVISIVGWRFQTVGGSAASKVANRYVTLSYRLYLRAFIQCARLES